MAHEEVYAGILARVEREELNNKCRDVAHRETKLIERRIRGARRALQHVYDVSAAVQQLPLARRADPTTTALVRDVEKLQSQIVSRMRMLADRVTQGPVVSLAAGELPPNLVVETKPTLPKVEAPQPPSPSAELGGETPPPSKRRSLKRRLSHESLDSPRKPPRPGRLVLADDENFGESIGPHEFAGSAEDDSDDETPMDLDVLDSDAEADVVSYLEKARRLRKLSSDRRMSELPSLIRAVFAEINRQEWVSLPRELLGTLSATLSAATTLKPTHREQMSRELTNLRQVALKIDEPTARRYPTLLGSRARFLSSVESIPIQTEGSDPTDSAPDAELPKREATSTEPQYSQPIEILFATTNELSKRAQQGDETKSLEELDGILELVGHVFDNPNAARSDQYRAMVVGSLDILIKYVHDIPRNTRRKLQCQQMLQEQRMQVEPN